jgi:hypothetical protein
LPFDRFQDFLPTSAEQLKIDCQFAIHLRCQRPAFAEPIVRPLHLEAHHFVKRGSIARG